MSDSFQRSIERQQKGQAVVEFVLALFIVTVAIAALYQALFFELDVFNKTAKLRSLVFDDLHKRQTETNKTFFGRSIDYRDVSELVWFELPFQELSSSHYGPKTLYARRGTRYFDFLDVIPVPTHDTTAIALMMQYTETAEDRTRWRQIVFPASGRAAIQLGFCDPGDQ